MHNQLTIINLLTFFNVSWKNIFDAHFFAHDQCPWLDEIKNEFYTALLKLQDISNKAYMVILRPSNHICGLEIHNFFLFFYIYTSVLNIQVIKPSIENNKLHFESNVLRAYVRIPVPMTQKISHAMSLYTKVKCKSSNQNWKIFAHPSHDLITYTLCRTHISHRQKLLSRWFQLRNDQVEHAIKIDW